MKAVEKTEVIRITPGKVYAFKGVAPKDCQGHFYRAVRMVKHVPVYQWHVLVECLTGPDKGEWYTCTEQNFGQKYRYLTPEEESRLAELIA